MARELIQVPDSAPLEQRHVQQIIASWLGLVGNGTDADLAGVPLRQTSVNDATLYAVDARNRGAGGLHYRATHSSGSPVLFQVTDSGVLASTSGAAASNPFVYSNMVLGWNGTAASIPSGWTVITAAKTRVIYGANVDGDVGATGGAATYDLSHTHIQDAHNHTQDAHNHTQDVHNHTQDAHNHTQDAHSHSHDHNFLHDHIHPHDHSYSIDHDHASATSAANGTSASVTDDGLSQVNVAADAHTHAVDLANFDAAPQTTGTTQNETWTMDNDAPGRSFDSPYTALNATNATATNQAATATNQAATATNQAATATNQVTTATNQSAGNAAQSTLPPFIRYYWIQRT